MMNSTDGLVATRTGFGTLSPQQVPVLKTIPPGLSLYLDLIRFLAAVSVVLYHTWGRLFPGSHVKWPGHEAVVIFFVLSGYVITHAASRPGVTLSIYVQHRAARILPVAIGALLLAILITPFIPSGTESAQSNLSLASLYYWWPTFANLFFIAQSGGLFVEPPMNYPFWSLNYEVWYYVIFGAWLFTPKRWQLVTTLAAALLAGPKILMLFPVWLMGVWLYKKMPRMSLPVALWVFGATVVVAAALTWLNVSDILRSRLYAAFPPAWHLHHSTQFLYDFLLGIVVSANFAAVAALSERMAILFVLQRPIRYLASFTFSTYVFHDPLKTLAWDVLGLRNPLAFYLFFIIAIFVLASLTERRTKFYRALLAPRRTPVH